MSRSGAHIILACTLIGVSTAQAAIETTWTGRSTGSRLWNDPINWSNGIPGVGDAATVRQPGFQVDLQGTREVGSLNLSGNVTLANGTIAAPTVSLSFGATSATLTGVLDIGQRTTRLTGAGGSLNLNSTMIGANSILQIGSTVSIQNTSSAEHISLGSGVLYLSQAGTLPNVAVVDPRFSGFTIDNQLAGRSGRMNQAAVIDHSTYLPGQFVYIGHSAIPVAESIQAIRSEHGMLSLLFSSAGSTVDLRAGRIETSPQSMLAMFVSGTSTRLNSETAPVRFGGNAGTEQNVVPFTMSLSASNVAASAVGMMTYDLSAHPRGGVVGFRPLLNSEFLGGFDGAGRNTNVRLSAAASAGSVVKINSLSVDRGAVVDLPAALELQSGMIWSSNVGTASVPIISGAGSLHSTEPINVIAVRTGAPALVLDIQVPLSAPSLSIAGAGRVRLGAGNDLPGGITLHSNSAAVFSSLGSAGGTGPITLGTSSAIHFETSQTLANPIHFRAGEFNSEGTAELFTSASIALVAGTTVTFNSPVDGIALLSTSGGNVVFNAGGTFAGHLSSTLNASSLELNGSWSTPTPGDRLTMAGNISGTADIPAMFLAGVLSPGPRDAVGDMHITEFSFREATSKTLAIDVHGLAADRLFVDRATPFTANRGTLAIRLLETPALGAVFPILNLPATSGIQPAFLNAPEGSILAVDGSYFRVSYVGGDGNDVTLTVVPEPAMLSLLAMSLRLQRRSRSA